MNNRLGAWCEMQRKVWHSDDGARAETITLKRADTDVVILQCPVDAEGLEDILSQALQMQADELPKGAHRFILVATDHDGKQLSELPQTVRGLSSDATTAAQEQIALAQAHAKALSNVDFANQVLQRSLEQLEQRLGAALEDKFAVLDRFVEQRGTNFRDELELTKFMRSQARLDTVLENLAPAIGVITTWAAEKLVKANPELLKQFMGKQDVQQQQQQPAAPEPASPVGLGVPQPEQKALREPDKAGRKRNGRVVPH